MPRKRFSEEQIISILKESAAGMMTEEVCLRHGICTNTFYRWKDKYADMEISDIRTLKDLKDVAKALGGGFSKLSRKTRLNREKLYRMLSEKENPVLRSMGALLDALGLELLVDVKKVY